MCDAGCVGFGAHGEDMQFVELGDFVQKVAGVRSESAMVEEVVVGEVEAIHILGGKG